MSLVPSVSSTKSLKKLVPNFSKEVGVDTPTSFFLLTLLFFVSASTNLRFFHTAQSIPSQDPQLSPDQKGQKFIYLRKNILIIFFFKKHLDN